MAARAVGKYTNSLAPTGGGANVAVVKPGKSVKLVGKSLGDMPLDISSPPAPPAVFYDADAWCDCPGAGSGG